MSLFKDVNLEKYLVSSSSYYAGRTGYNPLTLLKVVLYAFQIIRNNKYKRKEEIYECSHCFNCPFKEKCTKSKDNRKLI